MTIDTKYIKMTLDNGFLIAEYKPLFITIEVSKSVLETRMEFTKNAKLPLLLNCKNVKGVDKESRDFFGKPSGSEGLTATAIVIESKLQVFMANFLLKVNFNKTALPIKLFTSEKEAIKWLENYK